MPKLTIELNNDRTIELDSSLDMGSTSDSKLFETGQELLRALWSARGILLITNDNEKGEGVFELKGGGRQHGHYHFKLDNEEIPYVNNLEVALYLIFTNKSSIDGYNNLTAGIDKKNLKALEDHVINLVKDLKDKVTFISFDIAVIGDVAKNIQLTSLLDTAQADFAKLLLKKLSNITSRSLNLHAKDGAYTLEYLVVLGGNASWEKEQKKFSSVESILKFVFEKGHHNDRIIDGMTTKELQGLLKLINTLYPDVAAIPKEVKYLMSAAAARITVLKTQPTAKHSAAGSTSAMVFTKDTPQYEVINEDLRGKGKVAVYRYTPAQGEPYFILVQKDKDHKDVANHIRITNENRRSNEDAHGRSINNNVFTIWDDAVYGQQVEFYSEPGKFYPASHTDKMTSFGAGTLEYQDDAGKAHFLAATSKGDWYERIHEDIYKRFPETPKGAVPEYILIERSTGKGIGTEYKFASSSHDDKEGGVKLTFVDPSKNKTLVREISTNNVATLPKELLPKVLPIPPRPS